MSLDDSGLKSGIEDVLDHHTADESDSPDSTDDFAANLTDAIITYLGDVVIDYPAAPGIQPAAPSPIPDPSFSSGDMTPIVPPDAMASALEAGIKASIAASDPDSASASNWAPADAAYSAVLLGIGAAWQSSDGYIATGATVAAQMVGFDDAWAVGMDDGSVSDVAQELADRIHDATTAAMFTGAYLKGGFIGPAPHVSALS